MPSCSLVTLTAALRPPKPKLVLTNINNLDEKRILQSKNTTLIINDNSFVGSMEDDYINSLIYK